MLKIFLTTLMLFVTSVAFGADSDLLVRFADAEIEGDQLVVYCRKIPILEPVLEPVFYKEQPDYWQVDVVAGKREGVTSPAAKDYELRIPLSRVKGKKGVYVNGRNKRIYLDFAK